jgi:hypothetical protein
MYNTLYRKGAESMKITEFLNGRDVERQAVTRYISRHMEIFNGHTEKIGKELDLDSVAVEELEKVYPIPKPVTIINGVPHEEFIKVQQELINSQKTVNELQSRLLEMQEQIAVGKANELLLEDLKTREEEKEEEIKALQKELATEQAKTWFQKLLKK